nr:hypothetical protein KPHV_26970 [Kitasatospora purpeofusca]
MRPLLTLVGLAVVCWIADIAKPTVLRWWERLVLRPVRRLRDRLVAEPVNEIVVSAGRVLPLVVGNRVPDFRPDLLGMAIHRCFEKVVNALPIYAVAVIILVRMDGQSVIDAVRHAVAEASHPSAGHVVHDPPSSLLLGIVSVPIVIGKKLPVLLSEHGAVKLVPLLLASALVFVVLRRLMPAGVADSLRREPGHPALERRHSSVNWSGVAVLIATATRCARVHLQWSADPSLDALPRVSLRAAEREIRRAYQARGHRLRRHQRQVAKAHAAKVIGALRADEARVLSEPAAAFQDLAVKLTTIANRYAEGRCAALLEEQDLGAEPVVDRPFLRWLGVAGGGLGVLAAVTYSGLPTSLTGPAVTVGIATLFLALFRGSQLTDAAQAASMFRASA